MKIRLAVSLVSTLFFCNISIAQKLIDVKSVDLDASEATFQEKKLVIDNIRIKSQTTNPDDFVRGTFKFKLQTQGFVPESFQVFKDVGVFYQGSTNESYFAINASNPVTLTEAGNVYVEDQSYSITTSGAPYSVYLTVGQVLSFEISDPTKDVAFELNYPDGTSLDSESFQKGAGVITGAFPILQTGTYKVVMKPLVGGGSVSLTMMFGNANRQTLTTISSGYYIETNLRENLHDYYKYEIHLDAGDELNVEAPSSADSELVLVNSESVKIQDDTGLGIVYVSSTSEDYYLFVNDSRAFGTNYDGAVTVTKSAANAAELPPPTRSRGLRPAKPR